MSVKFTWDQSKFDAALAKYIPRARYGFSDSINKKVYYIARKAIWFTHKANALEIDADVGPVAWTLKIVKRGKRKGKMWRKKRMFKSARISAGRKVDVPLVAAIINARRGRKGEPGLQGKEMQAYAKRLWGVRKRSIGFLKSGWIEAREGLKKRFRQGRGETKPMPADGGIKRYGMAKGSVTPATPGNPIATIENKAIARHDKNGALAQFGSAGLQKAFDDETADTERYLAREAQVDVDVANKELK